MKQCGRKEFWANIRRKLQVDIGINLIDVELWGIEV